MLLYLYVLGCRYIIHWCLLQITGVRKPVVEEHKVLEECVTWRKCSDGLGMQTAQICVQMVTTWKVGIERLQALADISHSALCCHSNKTRTRIANPPNSAQLEGTPYDFLKLHRGPCSSVGMRRGTDTNTQMAMTNIQFASATWNVITTKLVSEVVCQF